MAELLIQSLGCPNCGARYEPETRNCRFCGSVLIVTTLGQTLGRSLEAHQVSESLAKWRQRLKEDPENAEAHFALGLSYLNSKLRDAALVHLRKAALLAPEAADTHYSLALALFNDGNILVDSPEYAEATKEIDYGTRLAPDFREPAAFKHFILARKLEDVDIAQALAEYRMAVELCPDIARLQNNLGKCYSNLQNLAQAEMCFRRAIDLDPGYWVAFSNLSSVMYQQKRYSEGIELGIKAVSMMGSATSEKLQAVAHNNLALCLEESKREPEALEHLKKAIALDPANPLYQENLHEIQATQTKPQTKTDCFVVTATMGHHSHPWVIELSAFRDHVLTRSSSGRCLVRCYSRVGPVFARLIGSSLPLRRLALFFVVIPALFIARLSSGVPSARRRQ